MSRPTKLLLPSGLSSAVSNTSSRTVTTLASSDYGSDDFTPSMVAEMDVLEREALRNTSGSQSDTTVIQSSTPATSAPR
jgi:hypothetical protein